jgi:hypothetical protein
MEGVEIRKSVTFHNIALRPALIGAGINNCNIL